VKEEEMKMIIRQDHSTEKGFTLMELLIVIVIIGILAVAVLAALNPLEQIRRATDSGKKANSRELLDSIDRYTASQGALPVDVNTLVDNTPTSLATGTTLADILSALETAMEIKSGALSGADFTAHYITKHDDDSVCISFMPESDKFQTDADASGLQADCETTCVEDADDLTDCHTCVPE